MKKLERITAEPALLLAAIIWGFAFVAQRSGARFVQPLTFNGVRFLLGTISVVPILFAFGKHRLDFHSALVPGFVAGCLLFLASTFQQYGIMFTTAGKAGFITGMYVLFVPIFGISFRHKATRMLWLAVGFSVLGLYLLAGRMDKTMMKGDALVLISAVFWAFHVLSIKHFTQKADPLLIAFLQFFFCAMFSLVGALLFEPVALEPLFLAAGPILYAGVFSVGIAFTLQVIGQKNTHPTSAAVILSMEAVFAVIGGVIILHETLELREAMGCVSMLCGILLAQLPARDSGILYQKRNARN